ncbi:hypothetical protein [Methanobrevibacter sp.]|uniref:hypothetical protein n=1 Tax=Methanobrevibacter sp. TaxID=66852 RepID=UPI003863166D
MLNKKIILLSIILTCLLAVSAVNAAENSSDINVQDFQVDDFSPVCGNLRVGVSDDLNETQTNNVKTSTQENTNLEKGLANNNNVIRITPVGNTFADIQNTIYAAEDGDVIELESSMYIGMGSRINIGKSITINGNCAILDAQHLSSIFYIYADNVVIKNITFKNGNATDGMGGAVYWSGDYGSLLYCNFTNNTSKFEGGAVYWSGDYGSLSHCGFMKNTGWYGGAFWWSGVNGSVKDCSFVNGVGEFSGGIYWSGVNGFVKNCSFINNTHEAIDWSGVNGSVKDCSFVNNSCGAIEWYGDYGVVSNCSFVDNTASRGGAIEWSGVNGSVIDCSFLNNHANSGDGGGVFYWIGDNGVVSNCSFVNNSATYGGGAICWNGIEGLVFNCIFMNNTAYNGGAIRWYGDKGNVSNCCFVNNSGRSDSGAVGWSGLNGVVCDSKFINNFVPYDVGGSICGYSYNSKVINSSFISNKPYDIYWNKYYCEVINCNYSRTNYRCNIIERSASSMGLKLLPTYIYFRESVLLNTTVTSGATGKMSIYIDDKFIKKVSINELSELNNLTIGNHFLKVIYHGDNYYEPCEATINFNVNRLDYQGVNLFFDEDCVAGDDLLITFQFDENDITGHINITFINWADDNFFTGELINGKTTIFIPNILGGEQEFLFNYSGDSIYNSDLDSLWSLYIEFKDSPISIDIPKINWNDTVTLNPILPKEATGNITLLIDNIDLANISVGNSYSFKANKGGKHNLTVKYWGDDYFSDNETTVEFYVNKLDSTFDMENTFVSEKYLTIPITLLDDANGDITVNINNNFYSGKVVNGSYNFTVTDIGAGTHNVVINYTNDNKYNDIYIAKEIVVNLKDSNLNLDIQNILTGQNLLIKPTITDGATGSIDIYVDGSFEKSINAGSSYILQNPSVGQHKIRLVYSGNTYFASCENEYSFRVFTIYPIEAADTQIVFGTDKKFQAKFFDEYGGFLANKYVLFIVNGEEYPVKTNSGGIAVLDVDLAVGEYNVTSVSLLDENTTNKLLIFHSVRAESMMVEYGSDTRFKATFLDETANPLSNTNIVFKVDGKDTMVKTDVNGVAILNSELTLGTHAITSINTITDESMTNKVVVVKDVNSIINVETKDINYNQKATIKVNIDSNYLNANVTIKVTGENGYEEIFTQKAAKTITEELSNLNASKYYVDVKYEDSDLLVIQKNATFNVLKIDPAVTLSIDDEFADQLMTFEVKISDSNGTLTIKIDDDFSDGQLVDGKFVMNINSLSVGKHSYEILFNGDNNYNPIIKTGTFTIWNKLNFKVDFESIEIYRDDECTMYVHIQNLTDNKNAILTLFIDGVKVKDQSFTFYEYDDEEYGGEIEFNASNLSEGIHNWKITYYDGLNYINSSQTGLVKVYHVGNPDKVLLVTNDGIIADIDGEFVFVKNGTIINDNYQEYYAIYSFTANGVEYAAIRWFPVTFYSVGCYKVFNPNEYKSFEGVYYKTTNGIISDVIDSYEEIDGVYYGYVGRPYEYYNNGYDKSYSIINGTCYKSQFYHYYEASEGVDYKVLDGIFYTMDDIKIDDGSENYDGFVIIKNGRYYFNDNLYFHHIMSTVGYEYVKVNNDFYRLIQTYENEELHNYALIDGKLYPVIGKSIGKSVNLDVRDIISENEISIPSLDNISGDKSVEVKLPADATGTVTLTVGGEDYVFDVVNGVVNVKLPDLNNGDYPYIIKYSGDSKYSSFATNGSLKVNNAPVKPIENTTDTNDTGNATSGNETKPTPEIVIPPLDEPSADGSVTITLPSDATGTVTLNINGQNYTFDVKNGVTNVKLPELGDGNYDYTITYSGDSKYSSFSTNGNMKVNNTKPEDTKPTPEIVIPPLDEPSNEGSVKVTLPSDATGKVTLSINGKDYIYLVENGVANVIIPNLGEGDYPYTITYSGDSKYSPFTTNGSLNKTVPKVDPKIAAKNTAVQYSAKGKYSVTVYGTDGKVATGVEVIFKISGKQVAKAKTNAKGVASYVVTKNPGKYKIQATALGKSVTKTITVKHIVTLKTVTLKKSAKKLTLQATLAKVNGKYLKKKTITFKINGKKVATAKTNSKGVAKITIKNPSVVKNLKVGKKVTYQATYLKDTVKKTAKIKK